MRIFVHPVMMNILASKFSLSDQNEQLYSPDIW